MGAKPRGWLQLAGAIDWPRTLQRAGVLLRAMRGDATAAVQSDHELELVRGEGLQRVIGDAMRRAVGCKAPASCSCETFCGGGGKVS
jgi:hypothetical protein